MEIGLIILSLQQVVPDSETRGNGGFAGPGRIPRIFVMGKRIERPVEDARDSNEKAVLPVL